MTCILPLVSATFLILCQLHIFLNAIYCLRPGAKLQLQGQMICRLGVLLLGPSNVRVLGGEVEDLVDRNQQVNFTLIR